MEKVEIIIEHTVCQLIKAPILRIRRVVVRDASHAWSTHSQGCPTATAAANMSLIIILIYKLINDAAECDCNLLDTN